MHRARPQVDLHPGTIAIADLHLDAAEPERGREFARWLRGAHGRPRLIVLGDLFDAWVGPAHARLEGARAVIAGFFALREAGTEIDLVPGNRDFLLDASFERATGAVLRPQGFVGTANGERVLFVHGDELCTRDLGYQRLRRVLRSGPVQFVAPRLPLAVATRVAKRLRRASVRALEVKLDDEKAMQSEACRGVARQERATVVVCGHAHAGRDESLAEGPRWLVLDAFQAGPRDLFAVERDGSLALRASGG